MRSGATAIAQGGNRVRPSATSRRRPLLALAALLAVIGLCAMSGTAHANDVVTENQLPGTAAWHLTNPATNRQIEGYASATSVNRGDPIGLHVSTAAPDFSVEVFRMGWYQGLGARRVLGPVTVAGALRTVPSPAPATRLVEAGWPVSYVVQTSDPTTGEPWASGVYLARLTESAGSRQSYAIFVVRDDAHRPDILFQLPVTTYQAYNFWGGKSLYSWGSGPGTPWGTSQGAAATKVSFDRPYAASPIAAAAYGMGAGEFLTNIQPADDDYPISSAGWDANMVRWLEREGYDVGYVTNIDVGRSAARVADTSVYLSHGHDEYWTWQMRANVEAARDAGVNLAFFSANTAYWQVRLEPSPTTAAADRVMVGYKNTATDPFATDADPTNDRYVTKRFREAPVSLPEAALKGTQYGLDPYDGDIVVADAAHWVFTGTGLANGDHLPGLLGYETDGIAASTPPGTITLADSPVAELPEGTTTGSSQMTIYTAASGAQVFSTSSIQWAWGLDDFNAPALRTSRLSAAAETITRNVLDRFTDRTPPQTQIDTGPAGASGSSSATFTFSSETGATFECRLDAGSWAACTSPRTLTGLTETQHTFEVRATDAAGNTDATPATRTFTVDTTPPDTTIDSGPTGTIGTAKATVAFSGEPGATFECRLDADAWAACTSPLDLTGLTDGAHTVAVRAVDAAGNVDATPATRAFAVDTTPPDTTIDSGPSGTVGTTTASVAFSGEAGATFECRLDADAWAPCTSPLDLTGLTDGGHTVAIRATDAVGNTDPSPATRTFTVDTTPPDTTIDSGPTGTIASASTTIAFSSEAGATFECRLDAGAWDACTSPLDLTGLLDGDHTFHVRATDGVGNADPSPATRTFTVDTTAPDTTIDSGPTGTIATASAMFTVSSEPGATFECRLDTGAWETCTSPVDLSGLLDGDHTLHVRASDGAGNTDATPATRTFTVDTTAPDTTIDDGPTGTIGTASATFTFSSEAGATFECRLDTGAWETCTSPLDLTGLTDGDHVFDVRATDGLGNTDATPATRSFTVDTTPPDTTIDSGPTGTTTSASATVAFSSEPGATLECRLDAGAWETCTSPLDLTGLVDGEHTLAVRATDGVGNTDPSPATRTFTVDTTAPDTTVDSGPTGTTTSASATVTFSSEPGATFECRLDTAAWATCTSPHPLTDVTDGDHTFAVRATDAAGNTDPSPATRTFTVDTTPPPLLPPLVGGPVDGPTAAADRLPPMLHLRAFRHRVATATRRGAVVGVGCSEACRLTLVATVDAGTARRLRVPRRLSMTAVTFAAPRRRLVRLVIPPSARLRLRDQRLVRLVIRATASDAAGNTASATVPLTLVGRSR